MDSEALDQGVDASLDAAVAEDMMVQPDMFRLHRPNVLRASTATHHSTVYVRTALVACQAPMFLRYSASVSTQMKQVTPLAVGPMCMQFSVGNDEVGRTEQVEAEEFVQWNERIETQLLSGDRLSICMYDADVFGDEEIGCLEFTSDDIVDQIRRYDGIVLQITPVGAAQSDAASKCFVYRDPFLCRATD